MLSESNLYPFPFFPGGGGVQAGRGIRNQGRGAFWNRRELIVKPSAYFFSEI